ncbi:acyloxyacyl hydrolase [Parabacteroides sp. PF5-9]|uniref:acyloxyacyl hydrolase n=1 Tax=Parabacteroides sp. PF5-9 TaxID=1742404 RepID=UPI0024750792|nr:acyloxyacyl hydrolase [Parabacteroides sp. PF5-9]MDH6357952.1 hypothetical protein [Parabacteroides sp. PF5-9]
MSGNIRIWLMLIFLGVMLLSSLNVKAQEQESEPQRPHLLHRIAVEARPGYIFPTKSFLKRENELQQPIRGSFSPHLQYAFEFEPHSYVDRIYGGVYQGAALAWYTFGNRKEIGNPTAFYLFQGARLGRLASNVSLNYEWNFGLSSGWHPYHYASNYYNLVIGSRVNAYINLNMYLNWILSERFDLTSGISLTHFSNGNTKFPNSGLNTIGLKVGLVYKFNREHESLARKIQLQPIPEFPRHISYDLVLFGAWRRKGVTVEDRQIASPDAYAVAGFSFGPMYNLDYRVRVGVALDGFYDGSANVYANEHISGTEPTFSRPSFNKQLALGVSGRAEYVMPYFSVGIGFGANILHGGGDLKAFYQILALKVELTRNSFLHIGYSLHDFHDPNFLMLGLGFRFNNKYPFFHR